MIAPINQVTELRLLLLANGYLPIPVTSPKTDDPQSGKKPVLRNWAAIECLSPNEVEAWQWKFPRGLNTGIICGTVVGFDIDIDDEHIVELVIKEISAFVGSEPPIRIGRPPRALVVFQALVPFKKIISQELVLPNGQIGRIEVLGAGQQFVVDGIHPITGKPYEWKAGSITEVRVDRLPKIDEASARTLIERLEKLISFGGAEPRYKTLKKEAEGKHIAKQGSGPVDPATVSDALSFVPNNEANYDFWLRMGFSIHSGLGDDGFSLWDSWSKQSKKYSPTFTRKTWDYFKQGGGVTIGTLFYLAGKNGWRAKGNSEVRSSILVLNGALHEAVDAAEQALLNSQIEIFQRSGLLVRPVRNRLPCNFTGSTETVTLVQVTENWLYEAFSRVAIFLKTKEESGEVTTINCPLSVVKIYLARVGEWRVPSLTAVVHAPSLRLDGSAIERPGYDLTSGLYGAFDPTKFPRMPERPNRQHALEAIGVLEAMIETFPFASSADKSVAIASILTGLSRHLFPTAPMFGYSAPVAGSGKSLLVDLCSVIVTGLPAAVLAPGRTEEELEKRLGAAFIQGTALIPLDNCNEALGGAFLCQVLTQSRVRTRILGQSTIVEAPTNCLMLATGNNLTFADDMTRRALLCTLDPQVERPEERQFEGDILTEASRRRGELVTAGLTILRAFHVEGRPCAVKLLGSFSEWSRFIRGALVWLGRTDPHETISKIRDNDPVLSRNLALLHQIDLTFGKSTFTSAELIEKAMMRSNRAADEYGYINKDLHLVLSEFSGGRDVLNAVSIGKGLSKLEGRLCGGMMLKKLAGVGGKRKWQLVGGSHVGTINAF